MQTTDTHTPNAHLAALWAIYAGFSPEQVDCTTTVVLKILDRKCRMNPGEQAAVLAIYDAVKHRPEVLFDESVHRVIEAARLQPDRVVLQTIHQLRIHAEQMIPKPIMKRFKGFLREGLLP